MSTLPLTRRLVIGIVVPLMILLVLASGPVRSAPVVDTAATAASVDPEAGTGADRLLP